VPRFVSRGNCQPRQMLASHGREEAPAHPPLPPRWLTDQLRPAISSFAASVEKTTCVSADSATEPSRQLFKSRVELCDRLFEHRPMRGCAGMLKISERPRPRQHHRGSLRLSRGVHGIRRDLRLARPSRIVLLRFHGLAFPSARHRLPPHRDQEARTLRTCEPPNPFGCLFWPEAGRSLLH